MKTIFNSKKAGGQIGHQRSSNLLSGIGAGLLLTLNLGAQNNVSYTTDAIPVPGGSENVVMGINSMMSNTGGGANATYGNYGLNMNVNGGANTAGGYAALYQNDGNFNSSFGVKSTVNNLTGDYNSALGAYAMLSNTTGNNNTTLGSWSDVSASNFVNATAVGNGAIVTNSDRVQLGDNAVVQIECASGIYTTSDGRFKTKISESDVKGLDFINRLRPVVYNLDTRKLTEFVTKNMSDEAKKYHLGKSFEKSTAIRQSGFIAQEVEEAAKASGYDFNGVSVPKDDNDHYAVAYSQFVVPLVKAVQEQQKMIDAQKQQIAELQKNMSTMMERTSTSTGLNQAAVVGSGFNMGQNEPNPFTRETLVNYTLPEQVNNAYMAVYDLSGKQVASFPISQKGNASITVSAEKLSAGIYIYSIIADGKVVDSKRMVVADK